MGTYDIYSGFLYKGRYYLRYYCIKFYEGEILEEIIKEIIKEFSSNTFCEWKILLEPSFIARTITIPTIPPPIVYEVDECAICLNTLHPRERTILDCGHMFHSNCCYSAYLIRNQCPICNKMVSEPAQKTYKKGKLPFLRFF